MALPMFQAVKANKASIVLSGHPREKMDQNLNISRRIILNFFNLDFTFSLAFKILSIKVVVLVENGNLITKVFIHRSILSHPTRPPRNPSL
jgi:hypothetical protein